MQVNETHLKIQGCIWWNLRGRALIAVGVVRFAGQQRFLPLFEGLNTLIPPLDDCTVQMQ